MGESYVPNDTSAEFHPSYCSSDGDLILISKDGVKFRVHSVILKLTSGFFRTMLSLPQGPEELISDQIPMDEDSALIAALLDATYPDCGFRLSTLRTTVMANAEPLIAAADKYEMSSVVKAVQAYCLGPSGWSALRKYKVACKYGWETEASAASTEALQMNIISPESLAEMQEIDAANALKLIGLHRKRRDILVESLSLRGKVTLESDNVKIRWGNIKQHYCVTLPDSIKCDSRWRAFLFSVSEEMERCSAGTTLRDPKFWTTPECEAIFRIAHQTRPACWLCASDDRPIIVKERLISEVVRVLDNLPKAVALSTAI